MYIKTVILTLVILATESFGLCQSIKIDPPSKNISFLVSDLSGHKLSDLNSDSSLTPASVTKLFTTYAALKELGVDYTFKTQIFAGQNKNHNQIAIVGNGDPVFNTENLYALLVQLKARGVKKIDSLILDDSNFIELRNNKGDRAYQAGTSALSINNNSEEVFSCRVIPDTPLKTCTSSYKSTSDTRENFKSALVHIASNQNIQINKIEYKSISNDKERYTLLYQHASPPLPKILFDLNHFSTNMIAEQIVFALGESDGKFSHEKGISRIKEIIQRDINQAIDISDGSGLSTKNKISAKQIYLLLKKAIEDPSISSEFLASMSIANLSGTLKKRSDFDKNLFFRGKTGMLDGVSSIAGYLTTKSGKQLILVSLQNGANEINNAKSWEESIINQFWEQN
jgi:D-alanyl-D-alanine carboxypeptidase/D-alanyl-D-alanine-endopeptidase (penicillin-binding protein 4)